MDLNARPVRCFIAVAEDCSFSRAALRMHLSQPALSAQIRALERQLGFDLFLRTSRHVDLTAEGRLFLGAARRFVGEAGIFNQAARDIRTNEIRVGAAVETALIPERTRLIEQFIEKFPHSQLQIQNVNQLTHCASLLKRDIDLAIVIEAAQAQQNASEDAGNIEKMILCQKPIKLVVPASSPLAALPAITLADLKGIHIVLPHLLGDSIDTSELAGSLSKAGAHLVRPPEGNSIAIEQFAARNRICAISLDWICIAAADQDGCVRRPIPGLDFTTALTLVRTRGEHRPSASQFWSAALAFKGRGDSNINGRISAGKSFVKLGTVSALRVCNTAAHG